MHRQQRQIDAQRVMERRKVLVQHHLHHLHQGRQHPDVDDEIEKAQIKLAEKGALRAQDMAIDQVVEGDGDHHDHQHRQAKAEGGVDVLGNGQEGAHAKEEGQRQVFHKDRLNEEVYVIVHRVGSQRVRTGAASLRASGHEGGARGAGSEPGPQAVLCGRDQDRIERARGVQPTSSRCGRTEIADGGSNAAADADSRSGRPAA